MLASTGREVARPDGTPTQAVLKAAHSPTLAVHADGVAPKRLNELVLGCREDAVSPKASLTAHTHDP